MKQRMRLLVAPAALLCALGITATACSSSGSPRSSTGTSTSSAPTSATSISNSAGTGPGTPPPKPLAQKTHVTFAVTAKIEVFAEPEIAFVQGEFQKENLDVSVQVEPANLIPQLLAQGQVQVALNGINAGAFNATYAGVGLDYIADPYQYQPGDPTGLWVNKKFLNPDGSLKKPLSSHFSVSLGQAGINAPSILQVEQYLEKNGLTYNDVTNVALAQPDIVTALENGSLDAGYANTPYANELTTNPNFQKVTGTALAVGDVLVGTTYLHQHRDVVMAVMRALIRTARTYFAPGYRNNSQVMGQIANWIGVPVDKLTLSAPVTFSQDMSLQPLVPILTEMQQVYIKLDSAPGATQVLQYKTPIDPKTFTDLTIVPDVTNGQ
jgi:ABC-type nitrate/sulfonate/bicarbonate transport system substrate-binding protein